MKFISTSKGRPRLIQVKSKSFKSDQIFKISFRHPANTLPTTYIGLEKWLQELWRDKDQLLETVYKDRQRMPVSSARQQGPRPVFALQYVSLAAWLTFILKILQTLLLSWSPWHWTWILFTSVFMGLISQYTPGIQEIEVALDNGILTQPGQLFKLLLNKKSHDHDATNLPNKKDE